MPSFIDTNIPVGYSIIHDKWHPKAKEFIESIPNTEAIFIDSDQILHYSSGLDVGKGEFRLK